MHYCKKQFPKLKIQFLRGKNHIIANIISPFQWSFRLFQKDKLRKRQLNWPNNLHRKYMLIPSSILQRKGTTFSNLYLPQKYILVMCKYIYLCYIFNIQNHIYIYIKCIINRHGYSFMAMEMLQQHQYFLLL